MTPLTCSRGLQLQASKESLGMPYNQMQLEGECCIADILRDLLLQEEARAEGGRQSVTIAKR